MARRYELKRRAERQDETRRRITEAAIELHRTIGPARTTVSAVAERAGVQRHTYYRHFPDERSLEMACSGLYQERNPLPDPSGWPATEDPLERLERGLGQLYAFYERNEPMLNNVVRDAEVDPVTREVAAIRMGPGLAAIRAALSDGLAEGRDAKRTLALLDIALDFHTWRSLVRASGLSRRQAVAAMVAALRCARWRLPVRGR
jgi:AcrR family transcriptional regulator